MELEVNCSRPDVGGHYGLDVYPGGHLHITRAPEGKVKCMVPGEFVSDEAIRKAEKALKKLAEKPKPVLLNGETLKIEPNKGPEL